MNSNSPISAEVHEATTDKLQELMAGITGDNKTEWTSDANAVIKLIEDLDVLKHPRYIVRTIAESWLVKEHYTKGCIARGETMCIALCRALIIIINGKGHSYSEHQKGSSCATKSSSTSTASSQTSRRGTAGSTVSPTRSSRTRRSAATKRGT